MKKVVLIGNTGMGNFVLEQLNNLPNIDVKLVITKRFKGAYPYYKIKELFRVSKIFGIKTFLNVNVNSPEIINELNNIHADYIIVATYDQIFRHQLLSIKSKFINFHPSLLPDYRGPSPVQWALLNNESKTGVTAHYIDEGIDTGPIIDKIVVKIEKKDTINLLLKKIHKSAGDLAFRIFQNTHLLENNYKQIKTGTYYKKPIGLDIISKSDTKETIINKIKAFGFFPGIIVNVNRVRVRNYKIVNDSIIIRDNKNNSLNISKILDKMR
jgi:methionyl-tRNA formyltransferase